MPRPRKIDAEDIYEICRHFRTVLEHTESLPDYKGTFPQGWCGSTSRALGAYLIESGYGPIEYVHGFRRHLSHAWLEIGSLIIDITADQFGDFSEKVFVSEDRTFHDTFSDVERRSARLEDALEYPASWILWITAQK